MKLHSCIVDDFYGEYYPLIRERLYGLDYRDRFYELDRKIYEQVAIDVPQEIVEGTKLALEHVVHEKIEVKLLVVRRSDETRKDRALVHHDKPISQFNGIVYFNDFGGTATVKHALTGLWRAPENESEEFVYREGRKVDEHWIPVTVCPAKHDRLFIVRSDVLHKMVLPDDAIGYGTGADARTVLVCFFDVLTNAANDPTTNS